MANTYTKTFADAVSLTEAQLNTGYTTVKPSLSNMALATTGSSANQVLKSTGNAVAPEFDDIGDILANGVMTAAGANAVLADVTSVSSTQANLIGNALNSSTAANNILANVTSVSSTQANLILANVTSVSSTQANLIAAAATRATGTTVGIGGVATGAIITLFETSSTSFVDIPNTTVTITTSGRPVRIELTPTIGAESFWTSRSETAGVGPTARIAVLRDTSTLCEILRDQASGAGDFANTAIPVSTISTIDFPAAGTYTYKIRARVGGTFTMCTLTNCRIVVYEL